MDDLGWVIFECKIWSVLQMHNPHSHSFHQTPSYRSALSFKFPPEPESPDEGQKAATIPQQDSSPTAGLTKLWQRKESVEFWV